MLVGEGSLVIGYRKEQKRPGERDSTERGLKNYH